jgi:hypothetical protein
MTATLIVASLDWPAQRDLPQNLRLTSVSDCQRDKSLLGPFFAVVTDTWMNVVGDDAGSRIA